MAPVRTRISDEDAFLDLADHAADRLGVIAVADARDDHQIRMKRSTCSCTFGGSL